MFLGKKRRFRQTNSKPLSVEGGVPPFSVIFFPLTFWPAAFRDRGRGGGGPPSRPFSVTGVFEPFPYNSLLVEKEEIWCSRCLECLELYGFLRNALETKLSAPVDDFVSIA